MSFCFRIRFHMGARVRIQSEQPHLVLPGSGDAEVTLKSRAADTPLKDAEVLVLMGRPYRTRGEAQQAAERWRGLIQKAFARVNIGADFGDRAATGSFTSHGLKMLEEQSGRRVVNDLHGIAVFECDPQPLFAAGSAAAQVGVQGERLVDAVALAAERDAVMADRDQLAYDLYSASFSETSADARFVLLMMAAETLIDP